jgi:CRP/FNR family transcriptional regulator
VLHLAQAGETFAEVAAIGNFPCPAHAQAIAQTRCVLLPLGPFIEAMQQDHELCLEMMTGFAQWVRRLLTLLEDLVLRDALGRTARFLLESDPGPDGTVQLPSLKRYVASHLNLTSETLSRTLSRLIEAGLVAEQDHQRVELRDRQALRAISDGQLSDL